MSRRKRRELAMIEQIRSQTDALRSGSVLAKSLMQKADAGVESLGLRKDLAPVIAIFSLTMAQTYSKKAGDKERFASALPFVAAEAFNRLVPNIWVPRHDVPTGPAGDVHALLYEAKRWHEET